MTIKFQSNIKIYESFRYTISVFVDDLTAPSFCRHINPTTKDLKNAMQREKGQKVSWGDDQDALESYWHTPSNGINVYNKIY